MNGSSMRRDSGGAVRAKRASRFANAATRYTGKWLEGEMYPIYACMVNIYMVNTQNIYGTGTQNKISQNRFPIKQVRLHFE